MGRPIARKPQARQALLEHFVYIGERNLGAAKRFLQAARKTFEQLAQTPQIGVA